MYRKINSPDDHRILQEDLQKLVEWSKTWQMEFNIDKCAIRNLGTLRNISKFDYKMKNQSLQVVKHHPYLGVELSDNMKYNLHIDSITSKASRVFGFVKRNLRHCPKVVKERAYQSLVSPKLEYSSTTWNPQQVTQKRQIEQVQRNAACFVSNKPFNYQNPASVTSMIQQLNWPTLEAQRRSSDLVSMYKVVHNLVAVPITYHPPK